MTERDRQRFKEFTASQYKPPTTPAHINPGTDTTVKSHPETCDLVKSLYNYAVEQFTSAEDDSEIETAFMNMLELFPQTHFARTLEWKDPCASHTPAQPTEAQQRIDAAIKALEIMRDRNDKKGNPVDLNFNDGVAYGCEEAIALLQAGDPK